MSLKILLVASAMLSLIPCAWTQTKREYLEYLKDTANAIYALENQSMDLKPDELERVSTMACRTLERLSSDSDFKKDLAEFDKKRSKNTDFQNRLKHDLDAFAESFAGPESVFLRNAGLSEQATSDILVSAAFLHDSPPIAQNAASSLEGIDKLRRDICTAAQAIKNRNDQVRTAEEQHKRLRKWGFGIGGLTLIAVDIAAVEMPPLAAASATIGGQLFGEAIK
jgi:hypothetical protein